MVIMITFAASKKRMYGETIKICFDGDGSIAASLVKEFRDKHEQQQVFKNTN